MLEFVKTLISLWHVIAFACGFLFVFQAYLALFGRIRHEPGRGRIIRHADRHLWLSGLAIIGLGMLMNGAEAYLANPKLWTKAMLITIWAISTEAMRLHALPRLRKGIRMPMLVTGTLSLSCWIYGAFLGVAHGLAYGKAPFWGLAAGFLIVLTGLSLLVLRLASLPALRPESS